MGMAASQARYLELTARKTDVEFQGQQINQQRTELADISAGMFSQLMALQVPVAPSSSNFTTTNYTFYDGANTDTITNVANITGDANYNSKVTYTYTQSIYTGLSKNRTDLGVVNVSGTFKLVNSDSFQTPLFQCQSTDTDATAELAAIQQICKDNPKSKFAGDVGYNPTDGTIKDITKAYYNTSGGTKYFYGLTDLTDATTPDGTPVSLTAYYASNINKTFTNTEKANIKKADSGRYTSIQLESQGNTVFNINATTTTDQNAYQDALNEYEYQQMSYQQEVNSINAKTSQIQAQDRTLELQLKQLDTEQEALSTELDSVKKVIDKNIDQTFKTFQ